MPYGFNEDKSKFDLAINSRMGVTNNFGEAVIIGDSWDRGFTDSDQGAEMGIGYKACRMLGIGASSIHNYAVAGAGYTVSGNSYISQLADKSSNANVGLVIIDGGQNDTDNPNAKPDNVGTYLVNLISRVIELYPNAEIHVFPLFLSNNKFAMTRDRIIVHDRIVNGVAAVDPRVMIHDGCYRWAVNYCTGGSGVHLSEVGYTTIATIMARCIATRTPAIWPTSIQYLTPASNFRLNSFDHSAIMEKNGFISLDFAVTATADVVQDANIITGIADKYKRYRPLFRKYQINNNNGFYLYTQGNVNCVAGGIGNGEWVFAHDVWPAGA